MFDNIGSFFYGAAHSTKWASACTDLIRLGKVVTHNFVFKKVSNVGNIFSDSKDTQGWNF